MFVSHGGPDDNEQAARRFIQTLKDKGYAVQDVATGGGHGWKDWRPLIDDSLRAFSARIDRQTDAAPAPAAAGEMDPVLRDIFAKEAGEHLGAIRRYLADCAERGQPRCG